MFFDSKYWMSQPEWEDLPLWNKEGSLYSLGCHFWISKVTLLRIQSMHYCLEGREEHISNMPKKCSLTAVILWIVGAIAALGLAMALAYFLLHIPALIVAIALVTTVAFVMLPQFRS